jgi:hypothetical protein
MPTDPWGWESFRSRYRGDWRDWRLWALCLLVLLLDLGIGRMARFAPVEDAYITFRVADHFARGDGLVYNTGERVEAISNFLFGALLGLGRKFTPASPATLALLLNAIALLAALAALARVADPPDRAGPPRLPWFALAFGGLHPAMVIYLFSGMETVFFAALLFLGFAFLVGHLERGWPAFLAGVALGLAADVRMEAAPFAALSALLVLVFGERDRRFWRAASLLAAFALVFAPALAWRWSYYGYPFPNPYYVKVVQGFAGRLLIRGAIYCAIWFALNWPAAVALLASWRLGLRAVQLRRRAILALSWIGAYLAYNLYVGGDYFPYHRFFVPTILLVAWALQSHADELRAWLARRRPNWRPVRTAVAFYLVSCAVIYFNPFSLIAYRQELRPIESWLQLGATLRHRAPNGCTMGVAPAGAFSYALGPRFIVHDASGLSDAVLAHKPIHPVHLGVAGHDREDWDRIFDLTPELVFVDFVPDDFRGISRMKMGRMEKFMEWRNPQKITIFGLILKSDLLARYDPVELRNHPRRAVFLIRKDAPPDLRRLFRPTVLFGNEARPIQK